jgi:AraC-like DNA-binding protein
MRPPSVRPTYSSAILKPFLEALAASADLEARAAGERVPVVARVSVETAHALLTHAVHETGDVDLGLRAARRIRFGELGVLDYVMCSSGTVRDAIRATSRFSRLLSDVVDVTTTTEDGKCIVTLETTMHVPRVAIDFLLGWLYCQHLRAWFESDAQAVTVCLPYLECESTIEHVTTFAPSRLRFGAKRAGFAFETSLLERSLPGANPGLFAILDEVADAKLGNLAGADTLTSRIRAHLKTDFAGRDISVVHVAGTLGVTPRTLNRHLGREGTTYSEIVDEVRRDIAVKHVEAESVPLGELAQRLQFTHLASFHRAFKRWTGMTPSRFRRARRP